MNAGASHRLQQMGDQVRCELSNILLVETRNPLFQHVTLTQVRISPDLQEARVYYDWVGTPKERQAVEIALNKAAAFLRRELAQRMELRITPRISFHYDETRELFAKAQKLLNTST